MRTIAVNCFEVFEGGGRYHEVHVAFTSTEDLATEILRQGKTPYRKIRRVTQVYQIFDDMNEYKSEVEAQLVRSAIAKLTADEIQALRI